MVVNLRAIGAFAGSALLVLACDPLAAEEGRGIDVRAFCIKLYGDSAGFSQLRQNANSWRCTLGNRSFDIDMNLVCRLQHGASYVSRLANPADSYSWSCVRRPQSL